MGTKQTEEVKKKQFPGLVDNAHWNRIAALAYSLDEARRKGPAYARQVVANAKALARSLHEGGVPVKCAEYGFTQSHQVFLDISGETKIDKFTSLLEEANIIVDIGIRLGTCEATRRGMKTGDMEEIAELITRVYKGEDPTKIRPFAMRIRKRFRSLVYT